MLEVSLSQLLNVSRTPIREALIALSEEGLVQYRPHRGYVVRSFSPGDIMNIHIVRESLESLACRLAAERGIDASTRQQLEECLTEGDWLLQGGSLSEFAGGAWGMMNDRLHSLIAEAAANPVLANALHRLTRIPYSSRGVVHWFEAGDAQARHQLLMVHQQHHLIVEAMCVGDAHRAETAMRNHIQYAANHFKRNFSKLLGRQPTPMAQADAA